MVHAQPQNPEVDVDFSYQRGQDEIEIQHGEDMAGMNFVEEAPDETMKEMEILPGDVTGGLNSIQDSQHDVAYQRMMEEMAILQGAVMAGITSIDNVLDSDYLISPRGLAGTLCESTEPCCDVADAADVAELSDLPSEDGRRFGAACVAVRASRRGPSRRSL